MYRYNKGLLDEMDMVLKTGTPEELDWIYRYYDQRFSSHAIMFIGTILAPVVFICGPAVLSQPLPGMTAFPFTIEPTWIWASLYVFQTAAIVQVGSMATVDFMYTILLWFIGARFELLSTEFLNARNEDDFRRCSSKHQVLIDYFDRLSLTTAPMVGLLFFVITFNVSTGGLVLVRNPPFFVAAKFVLFVVISAVQLFIFAWPADNLIDLSVKLRNSAYGCAWIGNSRKMVRDLIIVLQRSQRPLIITMGGIVPILSLEFFGGTIAASFSYLTTLRAMADKL
ncbi:odorant receptor 13a-like isoform X2 [Athalia rosae]|uniref:odorant receptor 13a-like isoform X2 n=1 Tax=Athalia rosae TaxID=37344 RepID=UPI0020332C46|nr:odorant receptor 13a-like isoform X2 [Athalia rosae]